MSHELFKILTISGTPFLQNQYMQRIENCRLVLILREDRGAGVGTYPGVVARGVKTKRRRGWWCRNAIGRDSWDRALEG